MCIIRRIAKNRFMAWRMTESHIDNINFESIESYMEKFGGGEIFISKDYWDEGIAIININNPEKKNAISGKMMVDFRKCINELEQWENGKGVLLCSLGENFCSGGDLDFARACGTSTDGFYMSALMQDVLNRLRKLPLLSVALIHGPTLGGGAEITIFCDQILAADNVKLGFVHGRMGIITAWGATTRLVKLMGERKATELLLTSKVLLATDCMEIGLANKIVSTANRMDEALNWMREHLKHHKSVTQSFKRAILTATSDNFENSLAFERQLFCKMWGAEPNRDALKGNIKHVKNKL